MLNVRKPLESIKAELDAGIRDIILSGRFKEWLDFLSSFHSYSFQNTMMIFMQKPEATMVKGFREWQRNGRFVKKGEKGIRILIPLIRKKDEKSVSGEEKELYGFRYGTVFDVEQTSGEELPEPPVDLLEGGGERVERLLAEWIGKSEVPVHFKDTGEANGYFHLKENYIAIHQGRSTLQQLKTFIHEYAHYLLHSKGARFEEENLRIKEAQAEAVAYVVMKHAGFDTGGYSFGYIAGWTRDMDIIKKIGSEIVICSRDIINFVFEDGGEEKENENSEEEVILS